MTSLHFTTFGDGNARLRGAARRLARQAERLEAFDRVDVYDLARLREEHPEFLERHGAFIAAQRRGLGLCIWKPFIIERRLRAMPEGAVLVYSDAGSEFTGANARTLRELIAPNSGVEVKAIELEPVHRARRWTTKYCLTHIEGSERFLDAPQICANIIVFRNTPRTRAFAAEWARLCSADDYRLLLVDRGPDEDPEFVDHRYDQAIFNLLLRTAAAEGRIELGLIPVAVAASPDFPLLGLRNLNPVSVQAGNRVTRRLALAAYDVAAAVLRW